MRKTLLTAAESNLIDVCILSSMYHGCILYRTSFISAHRITALYCIVLTSAFGE